MGSKGIKYALWLAPEGLYDSETGTHSLASDVITWRGELKPLVDASRVEHWQKWLGTMTWEDIMEQPRRFVLAWTGSDQPGVADQELEDLFKRLDHARLALLLAADICRAHGFSHRLGGEAASIKPVSLKQVRSWTRLPTLRRPHYFSRMAFVEAQHEQPAEPWFQSWLSWMAHLDSMRDKPALLKHAAASLSYAYEGPFLEHRLIQYMRTAEFVLGLPEKGGGRWTFADRALKIAPKLEQHWYVRSKAPLRDRLVDLFIHRSACVHAKIPFSGLAFDDDGGSDEAGQIEFLAEYIARECLRVALKHPRVSEVFANRDALEAAWRDKSFP